MPFAEGFRLAQYEIKSAAAGGFAGEIYRARDTARDCDVYLRILSHRYAGSGEDALHLQGQIAPLLQLVHPHVLPLLGIECSHAVLFAASEYQDGETLRQKLHRGRLPRERASACAVQLARALVAIHATGLFHCDVKPENILITREGTLRLMEAGLANLEFPELPDPASLHLASLHKVEPVPPILIADYASPEQVRGEPETWRSDLFSWGVILYEMLTGTRPFLRPTLAATTRAILTDEAPELPRNFSPALARIVRQALKKQPGQRFDSARDLAFAMESFGGLAAPGVRVRQVTRSSLLVPALISLIMLGVGLGAGALIARRYLRPTVISQLRFRSLTFSGHDSAPSASRDGKLVAFVSDRDGTPRIWVLDRERQQERPLTAGPDYAPRFAPDGKSVLFLRGQKQRDVYVSDLAGGKTAKVLARVTGADWLPGQEMAILWLRVSTVNGKPLSVLGSARTDGKDVTELVRVTDQALESPRVSPDGKSVAALTRDGETGQRGILIAQTEGSGKQHVLAPPPNPGSLSAVVWLAGQSVAYFQSAPAGAANIVRQDTESGNTTILGASEQGAQLLDLLGGNALVFDSSSGRRNLEEFSIETGRLRVLTIGNSEVEDPAYSADGRQIYFSTSRGGNLGIWSQTRGTSAFERAFTGPAADTELCLSGDGTRMLWSSNRLGHFEIFSANADGTYPRRVTNDGQHAAHPSIPLNGSWVVYQSAASGRVGIWKIRQSGVEETQLVKGDVQWPEVSPDGRLVLYSVAGPGAREIHAVRLEDAAPETFTVSLPYVEGRSNPSLGRAKWIPSSQSIVYIGEDEGGASGLYVKPLTGTAAARKLTPFDSRRAVASFAISPDGSRIALAGWERGSGLVEALNVPGIGR